MNTDVLTVPPDMPLMKATRLLIDKGLSNAPVVDEVNGQKRLVGFLSEQDCLDFITNEIYYDTPDLHVSNLMRHQPVCLTADTDILVAANYFIEHGYRHLPVVRNGMLLGIVSRHDILTAMYQHNNDYGYGHQEKFNRPDTSKLVNHRFVVG